MRLAYFFALSLFLHGMIMLLFHAYLDYPLRQTPLKETPLLLSLKTIHILVPTSLPSTSERIFDDKKLENTNQKMTPKAPNPILKKRTIQPQTKTSEKPVVSELPPRQEPLHIAPHVDNDETIFDKIQEVIARYKQYPKRAQREEMEGEVTVRFTWSPQGLHALNIIKPCKHKVLNEYSLALVQAASQEFPHINEPIDIVLPIGFNLR